MHGTRQEKEPLLDEKEGGKTEEAEIKGKQRLLEFDELPEWLRDNEHLLSGYRRPSFSLATSFASVFYMHNDTLSIWSHLFGGALFAILPFAIYHYLSRTLDHFYTADIIVFSTFFYGVAICFVLSTNYHIILNHSPSVSAFGVQIDFLGIIVLMWGATIPTVYYGLICDPQLHKRYWIVVTILALLCAMTTLHPCFRVPAFRIYRAGMFAGLGFSALGAVAHGLLKYGWETQRIRMSLDWMVVMATLNMLGAGAYAARVPERWFPRKYDLIGNSHHILHFAVILAGLAHMFGLLRSVQHIRSSDFSCSA